MKNKDKALNVDFIGGQEPMTKQEELAISEFIKLNKLKNKPVKSRKSRVNTSPRNTQSA